MNKKELFFAVYCLLPVQFYRVKIKLAEDDNQKLILFRLVIEDLFLFILLTIS